MPNYGQFGGFNPISLVPKEAPWVHIGIWDKLCNDGWRWVQNFTYTEKEMARRVITTNQNDFGTENVTVGHPMVKNKGPEVQTATFGVYVRDLEFMEKHREELDAFVGFLA